VFPYLAILTHATLLIEVLLTGQLQKMGILPSSKAQPPTPASIKRRSGQLDFSNLGPLKTSGTVGFSTFRDHHEDTPRRKKTKSQIKSNGSGLMDEDSDDDDGDDELLAKMEEVDEKEDKTGLEPEDARFSGELADGVKRIRVRVKLSFYDLTICPG
jgi:hypothetical protein